MAISNESKTLILAEVEKLKVQKTGLNTEIDSLQSRINDLKLQREAINTKLQKFKDDAEA
jgi:predicted  nucleic acid-binding Zn-ribbon protein